jgi:spore maturation protein CgeB
VEWPEHESHNQHQTGNKVCHIWTLAIPTWAWKQQKPLQGAINYLLKDSVKVNMLANLQNYKACTIVTGMCKQAELSDELHIGLT